MAFQKFFRRLLRFGAVFTAFVLIPEAIFFFALAIWKASRFVASVRAEGAPTWYLLISSIGLVTGAVFCLAASRRLLRPRQEGEFETQPHSNELEKVRPESRVVRRIGKIWLSLAFSVCVFVLPPLLFIMGLILDQRREAQWLMGVPIGIAIVLYIALLPHRWRRRK